MSTASSHWMEPPMRYLLTKVLARPATTTLGRASSTPASTASTRPDRAGLSRRPMTAAPPVALSARRNSRPAVNVTTVMPAVDVRVSVGGPGFPPTATASGTPSTIATLGPARVASWSGVQAVTDGVRP